MPRGVLEPGALIAKEGEIDPTAYLILSGTCRVFRRIRGEERTVRYLGKGEIFGELALLLDMPRTASVQVEERCTVVVIDRETLESTGAAEGWTGALMRALAQRFRDLEKRQDALPEG